MIVFRKESGFWSSISISHLRHLPDQQEREVFRFFHSRGYEPKRSPRSRWQVFYNLDDGIEKIYDDFIEFRRLFTENISLSIIRDVTGDLDIDVVRRAKIRMAHIIFLFALGRVQERSEMLDYNSLPIRLVLHIISLVTSLKNKEVYQTKGMAMFRQYMQIEGSKEEKRKQPAIPK